MCSRAYLQMYRTKRSLICPLLFLDATEAYIDMETRHTDIQTINSSSFA